jgi:hypothetical protein
MGHHIIVIEGRHALFNDTDLGLMQHFLCKAAEANLELAPLRQELRAWRNIGPGVWIDENLEALRGELTSWSHLMFTAISDAEQLVRAHGKELSLEYLAKVEPDGCTFLRPIPVEVCSRV